MFKKNVKRPDIKTRREMLQETKKAIIGAAITSIIILAGIAIADHYSIKTLVEAKEDFVTQDQFSEVKTDLSEIKTDVKDIRKYLLDNK